MDRLATIQQSTAGFFGDFCYNGHGQYVVITGLVMLWVWCLGHFVELHPDAYRDMFISVTIPYAVGAAVYYIYLFAEVRRANHIIEIIRKGEMNHE